MIRKTKSVEFDCIAHVLTPGAPGCSVYLQAGQRFMLIVNGKSPTPFEGNYKPGKHTMLIDADPRLEVQESVLLLVVPQEHVQTISQIDPATAAKMLASAQAATREMTKGHLDG